jgi:hypothetical protein
MIYDLDSLVQKYSFIRTISLSGTPPTVTHQPTDASPNVLLYHVAQFAGVPKSTNQPTSLAIADIVYEIVVVFPQAATIKL